MAAGGGDMNQHDYDARESRIMAYESHQDDVWRFGSHDEHPPVEPVQVEPWPTEEECLASHTVEHCLRYRGTGAVIVNGFWGPQFVPVKFVRCRHCKKEGQDVLSQFPCPAKKHSPQEVNCSVATE
jgi:hypothetical protein